jgi:hypothetical protein
MRTSAELRNEARLCKQAAIREVRPHLRRRLIAQGLAFAQLAEQLERDAVKRREETAA